MAEAWGDVERPAEINAGYEFDMDFDSLPGLCERSGLDFPEL